MGVADHMHLLDAVVVLEQQVQLQVAGFWVLALHQLVDVDFIVEANQKLGPRFDITLDSPAHRGPSAWLLEQWLMPEHLIIGLCFVNSYLAAGDGGQ